MTSRDEEAVTKSDLEELAASLTRITKDLETGPAKYIMNGRSKFGGTVIGGVLVLLVTQAVIGGTYFVFKAPTMEYVDQRITERTVGMPITREANMRLVSAENEMQEFHKQLDNLKESTTRLSTQMDTLINQVDTLSKEVRFASGMSKRR